MNTEYLSSRQFFESASECFQSLPRVFAIDLHPMGVYSQHWIEATQLLSSAEKLAMAHQMRRMSDIAFGLATSTPESLQILEDSEVEKQLHLLLNTGFFTTTEACVKRMGISRQELDALVQSGRVIVLQCREQRHPINLLPEFYANKNYSLIELQEVTVALGEISPMRKFRFFHSEFEALSMKTPLDAIKEGSSSEVLKVAKAFSKCPLFELQNVFNSTVKNSLSSGDANEFK